jgi:N utilization substance protein A
MSATPESKEEIRQLFRKHVPEVNAGVVEIVSVARDVGRRCYVAVRSQPPLVEPVGACSGVRGAHQKAMVADLKGEYLTIVRWEASPERFIRNAFANRAAEVVLDQAAGTAAVTTEQPPPFPGDVELVMELTGWKISVHRKQA